MPVVTEILAGTALRSWQPKQIMKIATSEPASKASLGHLANDYDYHEKISGFTVIVTSCYWSGNL